jgi:hypothetical protein
VKLKQKAGTRKIFGIKYQTREGTKTLTYFNDPIKKKDKPQLGKAAGGRREILLPQRHQILHRINAKECELCGYKSADASNFEVHHIRKLKDMKRKYSKRGDKIPPWVLTMSSMRRKTLVVCRAGHHAIHSGSNTPSIKKAVEAKQES